MLCLEWYILVCARVIGQIGADRHPTHKKARLYVFEAIKDPPAVLRPLAIFPGFVAYFRKTEVSLNFGLLISDIESYPSTYERNVKAPSSCHSQQHSHHK